MAVAAAASGRIEMVLFLAFFWGTCFGAWRNLVSRHYGMCSVQLAALVGSTFASGYIVSDISECIEATVFFGIILAVGSLAWHHYARQQYVSFFAQVLLLLVVIFVTWNVVVCWRNEYASAKANLMTWREDHRLCQDYTQTWLDSTDGAERCRRARENYRESPFWHTINVLAREKGLVRLFTNTGVGEIGTNILDMGFAPTCVLLFLVIIFAALIGAIMLGGLWIMRVYPSTQRLPTLSPTIFQKTTPAYTQYMLRAAADDDAATASSTPPPPPPLHAQKSYACRGVGAGVYAKKLV
jgi:MFS family permease